MLGKPSSYSTPHGAGHGFWSREPVNHGAFSFPVLSPVPFRLRDLLPAKPQTSCSRPVLNRVAYAGPPRG